MAGRLAFVAGLVLAAGGVGTLLHFCAMFVSISMAQSVQQLAMVSQRRRRTHDILQLSGSDLIVISLFSFADVSSCMRATRQAHMA